MIMRDFQGKSLSMLGFGAMRLPTLNGKNSDIDEATTQKMVDLAYAAGVNYYDTAWGYHDGNSELVLSRCLKKYPRDSYYLATKFPGYDLNNMDKAEQIFEKQLEKCGVDHFDFYLIHNVCELNINEYLDPKYGIHEYFVKQKANGRITHLGFSAHGSVEVMKRFLDEYGKDMEFCQIQLNYLDWDFQNAKGKVELLKDWNIPIWVMEPLRGGRLAKLNAEDEATLKALRLDTNIPAWAFRFLQSVPDVKVILSGMSNQEQVEDNLNTFKTDAPLNQEETDCLLSIANKMSAGVPCTACRYCTTHCPMELDIPDLIELYNEHVFTGGGFIAPMRIGIMPEDKRPSACIACGSCQAVCPQQIHIPEILADFTERLNKH